MNKSILALAIAAAVALCPVPAPAQAPIPAGGTDLVALRDAVRTDKRAYVVKTLQLAPAEEKKFWPVYDAYQRKMQITDQRRARLVEDIVGRDRPVSDRYAKVLLTELVAIEEDEAKELRALATRVSKVLPLIKAARYVQIENKIHATKLYDVAGALPYVQ